MKVLFAHPVNKVQCQQQIRCQKSMVNIDIWNDKYQVCLAAKSKLYNDKSHTLREKI